MGPMNLNINSFLSGVGTGQRGPSPQGQVIEHCFGGICLWRDHEPHPLSCPLSSRRSSEAIELMGL